MLPKFFVKPDLGPKMYTTVLMVQLEQDCFTCVCSYYNAVSVVGTAVYPE